VFEQIKTGLSAMSNARVDWHRSDTKLFTFLSYLEQVTADSTNDNDLARLSNGLNIIYTTSSKRSK